MGLNHGSSQTVGMRDITASWEAFEHINKVTMTMRLEPRMVGKTWSLWLYGCVWEGELDSPEVKLLASESVRCSDTSWLSLDTAVFRLMYALDAALAFREMGGKRETA